MGNSGWNRPSAAPKAAPKKTPGLKHGILAGLLIVALGGLCLWMFSGGDAAPRAKPAKDRGKIKAVTPARTKVSQRTPLKERVKIANDELTDKAKEKLSELDRKMKEWTALTNRPGTVILSAPLLKKPTDQLYFTVFSRELGDMPPMTPWLNEKDEIEAVVDLGRPLQPEEGDDDYVKNAKELVNQVKDLLNQFISEGGTVNQFFDHYCLELEGAFEFRNEARRQLNKAVDDGDAETALAFEKKINEMLDQKGIKRVSLSKQQLEELEIER